MFFVFEDLLDEELVKKGKAGVGFWIFIWADALQSVFSAHLNMIKKQGLKNYFRISNLNILGIIFLLPFLSLFGLDFIGRIVQFDLTHYNMTFYKAISHTFLYVNYNGHLPFLWTALIFLPVFAVLINLFAFTQSLKRLRKLSIKNFLLSNPVSLIIILIGLFNLLVVFGHDFIPCLVQGVFKVGLNLPLVISVCRNV